MSHETLPLPVIDYCWSRIGVNGNGTCPELKVHTHCRNCPTFSSAGYVLYNREPPPGYIEEWTDRIAKPDPRNPDRTIPVVLFRIMSEWLALDVSLTIEVSPVRTVRRIPHQSDKLLAGLVNIRGELLPAIDLHHLFGDFQTEGVRNDPLKRRLLVAEKDGSRWVFLVDEVFDIRHFAEDDLGSVPGTVGSGPEAFSRGVFTWNNRTVGYLDPERLFTTLNRSFR